VRNQVLLTVAGVN